MPWSKAWSLHRHIVFVPMNAKPIYVGLQVLSADSRWRQITGIVRPTVKRTQAKVVEPRPFLPRVSRRFVKFHKTIVDPKSQLRVDIRKQESIRACPLHGSLLNDSLGLPEGMVAASWVFDRQWSLFQTRHRLNIGSASRPRQDQESLRPYRFGHRMLHSTAKSPTQFLPVERSQNPSDASRPPRFPLKAFPLRYEL